MESGKQFFVVSPLWLRIILMLSHHQILLMIILYKKPSSLVLVLRINVAGLDFWKNQHSQAVENE